MTKRLLILCGLLIAVVSAGMATARGLDEVKIDGKWSGAIPRPSRSYDCIFEFKADGEKLAGKVYSKDLDQDFDIVGGKIKGNTISFRVGGTQGNYTATLSGDEINGEVTVSGGEFGNRKMAFKLTRVKE